MLKKLLQHISIPLPGHEKPKLRRRIALRRYLAAMLCGCMMVPTIGSIAMATEETAYVSGPCEHHTEHDADCGYVEAVEGADCQHIHDENCGYVEAKDEVPCLCTDQDGDGIIDHAEGCGYQAPVEGQPCNHVHDADCGYAEAVEGQPCGYVCEICSGEEIGSEPTPLSDAIGAQPDALVDNADNADDNTADSEGNPLQVPELITIPQEQTCTITVPERELIAGQSYTLAQLVDGVTAEIEDTSAKTDETEADTEPTEKPELAVSIQKIMQTAGEETQTFDPIAEDFSLSVVADATYTITYFAYNAADELKTVLGTKDVSITATAVAGNVMIGSQSYDTLADAIAAAEANAEIKVMQDLAENVTLEEKNVTINLNGHTLNSGEVGKNVVTILGGTVTIQNGVITGGSYTKTNQDGKGVLTNNAEVILENCEIKNNKGYGKKGTTPGYEGNQGGYGGGVYAYGGTLTLEKCTISENKGASKGGGIYAENCAVTVKNTKLKDNTSGGGAPSGGGITISNGSLKINDSVISGNIASNGNGNAIALTQKVDVSITNTEITSTVSGSAIYASYGSGPINLDLENVEVVNKNSANTLYAIYSSLTGTFTAKDCTFHDSNGCIYLSKVTEQTYTNCKFLNNDATYRTAYAPVYLTSGDASFTGCTFTGNKGYTAGAIHNASTGTVTIDGCLFNENSAANSSSAGAIYTTKGTMTVTDTVIKENTTSGGNSSGTAGGVSVNGSGAVFNMDSGAIYNNKSEKQSTPAHDVYISSSAKANILAGKDMKDGDVNFSSYSWSDLTRTVIKDKLSQYGNWVATPAPEYVASVGETQYKTLDDAYEAARAQSRRTGENVTVEVAEGYIPLGSYWGVSKKTAEGPYCPSVTLHLNNTNIYGINGISNSFSIGEGCTLTLSGTGTLNKKIYMMGGTLNLDGNVVVSGGTLQWGKTAIYDNKNVNTKVNINGNVDSVQIGLYAGACTVGENAHVGKMDAWMTSTSSGTSLATTFNMKGSIDTLSLRQATDKSTSTLNGSIGSLDLTYGTEIYGSPTVPTVTAGEKFSVEKLNVYPALNTANGTDSYYKETEGDQKAGRNTSDGLVSLKALQDPAQKVDDLILIHGGGAGLPGDAVWTTSSGITHTDKKDYKFLTTVTKDENNNIVLRKTAVGNGNYVFIGGSGASDDNDGITLNTPVKTFAKALEILKANLEANKAVNNDIPKIHVLGTVSVTGDETWDPITASVKSADGTEVPFGETVTLESFPTFNGELVNVPSGARLTLQNITIDGKKISRTTPLVENRGTLNINDGAKLTGGVNSVIYNPNNGSGIDGGAVYNSGTLNMSGGEISGNSARTGGGVFNKGTFTLSDGTISNNIGYDLKRFKYSMGGSLTMNSAPAGGGVFLSGTNGVMNMFGGTISGNTSCVGGGISLGNETNAYVSYGGAKLNMTGGIIDGNTAVTEGGGIFIQEMCEATISGGSITNNKSEGSFSVATGINFLYGGGGIYVNGGTGMTKKDGVLRLKNAAITGNTSNSNGGGIAGCPSANVEVMMGDSSVLGNNTVNGKLYDAYINRTKVVGPAGTTHSGGTKFYLSKYMKGGALYNWHYYEDDTPVLYQDISDITYEFDAADKVSRTASGFYSKAGSEVIDKAAKDCDIIISGNSSVMGGGGIGTNGLLEIGTEPASNDFFDVIVHKNWINAEGNPLSAEELAELKSQVQNISVTLWRRVVNNAQGPDDNWEKVDGRLLQSGEDNFWKLERPFTNLLKQLDGKDLEYRVVEEASLTGVWSEINGGTIRIATPPIRQNDGTITVDASVNTETIEEGYFNANIILVGWDKATQNLQSKYDSFSVTLTDTKRRVNWTWRYSNGTVTLDGSHSSINAAPEVSFNKQDGKFIIKNLPKDGVYTTTVVYAAGNTKDTASASIELPEGASVVEVTPKLPTEGEEEQPIPGGFFDLTAKLEWSATQTIKVVDENGEETTVQKTIDLAQAKTVTVTLTNADGEELGRWAKTPDEWKTSDSEAAAGNQPALTWEQQSELTALTFKGLDKDGEYNLNITYSSDGHGDINIASSDQPVSWSENNVSNSFGVLTNRLNLPSLTLVKEIVGNLNTRTFTFTITLPIKSTNENGEPIESAKEITKEIIVPEGATVAEITLTAEELQDVKVGGQFTVTEGAGDWTTTGAGTNVKGDVSFDSLNRKATGTLCYGENTVTFTNAEPGTLSIPVKKILNIISGKPKTIPDFTFTLSLNEDESESKNFNKVKMPENTTLTIEGKDFTTVTETGEAVIGKEVSKLFAPITFEEAGTYAFNVTESDPKKTNWTYDKTEWTVIVNVVSDKDGKLEAKITEIYKALPNNDKDKLDDISAVPFTNTYEAGSLTISKQVTGAGDKDKPFQFKLVLLNADDTPLSTSNSDITVTGSEGVAPLDIAQLLASGVQLKHGQSVTISNLPIGTKYKVSEEKANQDGYTTTVAGTGTIVSNEATGSIQKDITASVTFTNHKDEQPPEPQFGALTISKVVSGNRSSTQRDFTFTVTLRDANGNLLAGTYPFTGSREGDVENGTATFLLRHGQSITISGLPAGTTYEVTEEAGDYSPTVTGGTGTITAGTTSTAAFDNYRSGGGGGGGGRRPTPDTEIDEPPTPQVYYPGEEPDPNEPDSPEEITIIDEDVPQTYIKTWDPENEEYVYIPEEPTPLAPITPTPTPFARLDTTPKTDDPNHPWFWLGLCFASILGIGVLKPRKNKEDE